jgi:hypothetical protein
MILPELIELDLACDLLELISALAVDGF